MIPHAAEIRAWTLANERARREYQAHPNADSNTHGWYCAGRGCEIGLQRVAGRWGQRARKS